MNDLTQATTNPSLGVLIFALGGLAGAVFYLPFKKVRNWAWESYWFVYAVFGLIVGAVGAGIQHLAQRDLRAQASPGRHAL